MNLLEAIDALKGEQLNRGVLGIAPAEWDSDGEPDWVGKAYVTLGDEPLAEGIEALHLCRPLEGGLQTSPFMPDAITLQSKTWAVRTAERS